MAERALMDGISKSLVEPRAALPSPKSRRPAIRQVAQAVGLSVVIVNYRQWESTAALVRQILKSPAARQGAVEVVIVDNHSPWHPLAARMRRLPGVSMRRWGRNHGFARAVNEGCRLGSGNWFLLLNPDMTLPEGFIDGVLSHAGALSASDPRAGIVGLALRNSDDSIQYSCGAFPTLASTLTGLLLPRSRRKCRAVRARQRCRVPWVTGCCLLLRRECFSDLGGLDESFFLYYEDVDLCRRARAKGWSVWHEPGLAAFHHQPSHSRPMTPTLRIISRHSLLTYGSHHWPAWQYHLLAGIIRFESWSRRCLARWQGDQKTANLAAEMGLLAREMGRRDWAATRRRLRHVARGGDPRGL